MLFVNWCFISAKQHWRQMDHTAACGTCAELFSSGSFLCFQQLQASVKLTEEQYLCFSSCEALKTEQLQVAVIAEKLDGNTFRFKSWKKGNNGSSWLKEFQLLKWRTSYCLTRAWIEFCREAIRPRKMQMSKMVNKRIQFSVLTPFFFK